jgi:protein involved in polysaccharide export with SLBB domain
VLWRALSGALLLLLASGCHRPLKQAEPLTPEEEVRLTTYYLSPGDEIRISVYGYPDLDRTLKVPPDGHIDYPVVGELAVDGVSIPDLRQTLTQGLKSTGEQRIEAGNELHVTVYRHQELDTTVIVPSSGSVNLPLAGEVPLAGLTVEEANAAIEAKLAKFILTPSVNANIGKSALPGRIADPQVSIEVLQFGGQKILVLGEVEKPGVYLNEGGARLLDMIAAAGGATPNAQLKTVAVVRPGNKTTPPQPMVANVKMAVDSGDLSQNILVVKGDVIYVPKTAIANVAQFFEYLYTIVRPIVDIETGIWLYQNIDVGPRRGTNTVVFPNRP